MKTFLTQYYIKGKLYAGIDIYAKDFSHAKSIAKEIGLRVVGEKLVEFDYCEN